MLVRIFNFLWRYRLISITVVLLCCAWPLYNSISGFIHVFHKQEKQLSLALKKVTTLETTNGQLVQEAKQYKVVSSDQIARASDSIFKLKDSEQKLIKANKRLSVIAMQVQLGDTIKAAFTEPQPNLDSMDCDSLLQMYQYAVFTPAPFEYESDTLNISGIVQTDGISITSLYIPDTMYERDVVKKRGLFGWGRQSSTQIYHSNSMFSNMGAAVYTVKKQPTWWQKTGKPVSVATIATTIGVIVTKAILNSQK
jgi:hypothetical protein